MRRGLSRAAACPTSASGGRRPTAAWRRRRAGREALLELAEAAEQFVERKERRPAREAHERHLQRGAHLTALHDLVVGLREPAEDAREVVGVALLRERDAVFHFLVRQVEEPARLIFGAPLRDDDV